ncbi:transketolase [Clostridia bacterium]|nr:transketolase [Clostridia bacterium]
MKPIDQLSINTLRLLAADEVQQANSGHPGLPMGAAPILHALFKHVMRFNPTDPSWRNRDRFVLSGGHGSAGLYAILHLAGYDISLDELKRFRQLGSLTPGHPEYAHTPGVDTTTGPLGQGVANAVGFAIAEARLAAEFNTPDTTIIDHRTYCLCGDGDMMEGIASEAASLAGTLKLGKLTVLYDDNEISIEGCTDLAFTDNVPARFESYGWHVIDIKDGNDLDAILFAIGQAKADPRPSLIVCHTTIGFGSSKAGKASAHGEPLGADCLKETKRNFGFDDSLSFFVPDEVATYMNRREQGAADQAEWNKLLASVPDTAAKLDSWYNPDFTTLMADESIWEFSGKTATRNSGGVVLNRLADKLPNLFGGSADLAPSNKSDMKKRDYFSADNPSGSNMHFGVREHAMASICNGIAVHGGLLPYCATFFVFSDYMRGAMRISALEKITLPYILTHDSIGVGEDGPTHQPVEHLDSLRALPNMLVFRPADSREVAAGWLTAVTEKRPTCLILTRQDLPLYDNSGRAAFKGGYILSDSKKATPDALLIASGSEVEQMMEAQVLLAAEGIDARVVSIPCIELFLEQSDAYKESVLPNAVRVRVAMEAATGNAWHQFVGLDGAIIRMEGFGASAPAKQLFDKFGFTAKNVVNKTKQLVVASQMLLIDSSKA